MTKHYDMYFLTYVDVYNNNLSHCNPFICHLLHVCVLWLLLCNKQSYACLKITVKHGAIDFRLGFCWSVAQPLSAASK